MYKKVFATIFFSLFFCHLLMAQTKSVVVNGTTRTYLEYVPANLGSKRPLLISAHGMNQNPAMQKNDYMKVETLADKEKFVTVFPQGEGNAWDISGDKDINFILALIDKMAKDYDIDRNRVYMSGFSMGGMLTYHCMNKIYDKIAAFAPISGYPMGGYNCTAKRPLPVIHVHGTSDDVVPFSGVQNNLNQLISYNKCNTTATVTKNYKGYSHVTRHEWSGGTNGTKVVLMELAGKGHFVSNDGLQTVEMIWEFVKNYSLEEKPVQVEVTFPEKEDIMSENSVITGTAKSIKGNLTKLSFEQLVGSSLKVLKTETLPGDAASADFSYPIKDYVTASGTYHFYVRATDDKGNYILYHITANVQKGYVDPGKCIKYSTTKAGENAWDAQANYNLPVALTKGKQYTLSMNIRATMNVDCAFWPTWETSPSRNQWGGTADVMYLDTKKITTEWTTYTWKFTAAYPLDRLSFVFGKLNGDIFFDDIVLVEDNKDVNYVKNGDFAVKNTDGWLSAANTVFALATAEGQVTSVNDIQASRMHHANGMYTLLGQRVTHAQKGNMYIVNNKKIIY